MNKPEKRGSYEYTELSTSRDEIRLVSLQPGLDTDQICCGLQHVSLGGDTKYTALSYTWGDPADTRPIFLDGYSFMVTANLKDALWHLRDRAQVRVFWIDALCINQSDLSERSLQVLRMRDIYGGAERVEVWLGTASENDAAAIDLVQRIGQIVADPEELLFQGLKTEYKEAFTNEFELTPSAVLKALNDLFRRQWWTRVWVVQELSLANQPNACVTCGNSTVQWIHFLVTAYAVEYCWFDISDIVSADYPDETIDGFHEGIRMSQCRHVRATEPPFRLLELLHQHRDCDATDPRDHIYGLLGMSGDGEEMGVKPDYSKTPQMIHTDLLRRHVEATGSLDMICACQSPRNLKDLPSWVPDWSMHRQTSVLCINERYCFGDSFPGSPSSNIERYRTAGDSAAEVHFSDDGLQIAAKGFKMGQIVTLGNLDGGMTYEDVETFGRVDLAGRSASDSSTFNEWFNIILDSKGVAGSYPSPEKVVDSFYRTLVANRNNRMMKPPPFDPSEAIKYNSQNTVEREINKDLQKNENKINCECDENEKSDDEGSSAESEEGFFFSPMDVLDMTESAFRSCIQICFGKRLAILDSGYIGLVPGDSKVGDEGFVMLGCSLPLVLRKVEPHSYVLVGESYFHGVTDGELLADQSSLTLEAIDLR